MEKNILIQMWNKFVNEDHSQLQKSITHTQEEMLRLTHSQLTDSQHDIASQHSAGTLASSSNKLSRKKVESIGGFAANGDTVVVWEADK